MLKNARYRKHSEVVNKVLFIPGTFEFLSLGGDGKAILWDYKNNTEEDCVEFESPLITGIISSMAKYAFISTAKPSLIRFSLVTMKSYEYPLNGRPISMQLS